MDPATLGALIQAGAAQQKKMAGAAQFLFSGQRKAEKKLTKEIEAIPEYTKSPSILDFYEQARQRYGISPTQTAAYKRQMANIQRAGATALAGAGGARGRMGAASTVARQLSDAALGAEVAGEQEKARRFGQLGQAAQMMRGEDVMAEQRKLLKQQQRLSQAAARAAGAAAIKRAGLTNIFGAMSDLGKAGVSLGYSNPTSGSSTTMGG